MNTAAAVVWGTRGSCNDVGDGRKARVSPTTVTRSARLIFLSHPVPLRRGRRVDGVVVSLPMVAVGKA